MSPTTSSSWAIVLPSGERVPASAGGVRFGREQGACDVLLSSGKVSRTHAVVWTDEQGQPWVKDLGSANGTAVDGERVTERQLRDGAVVQLGDVQLRVVRTGGGTSQQAHAAMGDPGYVFGGTTAAWAPNHELPSASPIFDREAIAPVILPGSAVSETGTEEGGGMGALGKLIVFIAIILLGAMIFFDISRGKLEKQKKEVETKSPLASARIESQRMAGTTAMLKSGELVPQPPAICNSSGAPIEIDWIAAAVPVANTLPGEHVAVDFNSLTCPGHTVTIPAGARFALADLQKAWPNCKLPATVYLLATGNIQAQGKEWTRAEHLSAKDNCLRLP